MGLADRAALPLVWACGLLFVFLAVTTGATIHHLAGAYPYLLAAGMVAIDGWLAARPSRVRTLLLATAATSAALPLVPPVPPAADTVALAVRAAHDIADLRAAGDTRASGGQQRAFGARS